MKACAHFKQGCGGCDLITVPYREQLAQKQKRVDALYPRVLPILGMETPYRYRNKAIATFGTSDGRLVCGMYRRGTHMLLPLDDCLLHDEHANELLAVARECCADIPAYDEDARTGILRHMVARVSPTQRMLTLVTATETLPNVKTLCARITQACPDITTIVQNINPRQTNAVLGYRQRVLLGAGYIEDTLCGCRLRISSRAFYQVNRTQTERLYAAALDFADLDGSEAVLDAYCSIGVIGLIAARRARRVLGVELNASAVRDAQQNAALNGIDNISFITGDAGQALARGGSPFDVVFIDPPRAGCDNAFLRAVVKSGARKIIYIACDIMTQKRDVTMLASNGYRVRAVQPVDMFPHTNHIECIVSMTR